MVYLNQNDLCRLYKSQTGRTIIQDLTRYRLSKAKQLLERGCDGAAGRSGMRV